MRKYLSQEIRNHHHLLQFLSKCGFYALATNNISADLLLFTAYAPYMIITSIGN